MPFQLDPWKESAGGKAFHRARASMRILTIAVFVSIARAADDDGDSKTPPLPKDVAEMARKYAGITEWQGFFESSTSGTAAKNTVTFSRTRQFEARSHGHFTLKSSSDGWDPRSGNFKWGGNNDEQSGEVSGSENDQWSERDTTYGTSTEWRSEMSGTQPLFGVGFEINLLKQDGKVHMGFTPGAGQLKRTRTGQTVVYLSTDDGQKRHETQPIKKNDFDSGQLDSPKIRTGFATDRENATREWAVVRAGPGVLTFNYQHADTPYADNPNNDPVRVHRSRIILVPVYDDLELEVTIEGYAKWRPKGSIEKPKEPGNSLVARATLKSKTGKLKLLPEVKRITFQLLDTSREPGVCLNWPLNAKDTDFDLRLAAEGGGELSAADQKLAFPNPPKDDKEQPYAEARVDSYDFGARASLLVVCELEDGREIIGLMKDEGGEQDFVRLPKMKGPDWIAEAWRKEKKVEKLAALDDDEKVEGQQFNGDGYTLYEEYRGWVVNGKHVEGDPERKDFFVLNGIGADAKGGLELFERASKLKVHGKLLPAEMSQDERLLNGNHRDAPHRVDQHGVWMFNADGTGIPDAGTTGLDKEDAGRALRPGRVRYVTIETRTINDAIFGMRRSVDRYNLTERDATFAYDRAVAHELLHAVGVDHHGEGEEQSTFYFQSASDPNNPTRRARFVLSSPNTSDQDLTYGPNARTMTPETLEKDLRRVAAGTLIWEDTRRDVAESLAADFERALAAERARSAADPTSVDVGYRATKFPSYGKDAFYWRESEVFDNTVRFGSQFQIHVTICNPGKADSGNELCLMRYYFANAYPVQGSKETYYLVRPGPGTNRAGRAICTSPTGTIHNAPSHSPQSRFGNAAPGRGNCFDQICPNDAIPPRKL